MILCGTFIVYYIYIYTVKGRQKDKTEREREATHRVLNGHESQMARAAS